MINYRNSLLELIDEKLNNNSYGIKFDTQLFSYKEQEEFIDIEQSEEDYTMITTQYVPTIIPDFASEYIDVPNVNATNNVFGVYFYLFNDDIPYGKTEEFASIDYENTLLAIDEFVQSLLAKYHTMGTNHLFFGGDDSSLTSTVFTSTNVEEIKIDFIPLNNDNETLLSNGSVILGKVSKNANSVVFTTFTGTISVPYTIDVLNEITITFDGTNWSISNNFGDTDTIIDNTVIPYSQIDVGLTTGTEMKLKYLSLKDSSDTIIELTDIDDKTNITNTGTLSATVTASNCILWGDAGNAVFGFSGLTPVGGLEMVNGYNRQPFMINIEAMASENAIFGNNFEYFLDDIQVYPVGRTHTFAGQTEARHKLGKSVAKSIVQESILGLENTFFYIPSKQMTNLLRKITTKDITQNNVYELKVQYPFYQVVKNVIIDEGGLNAMVNTLATFTIQYKDSDEILD